MGVVLLSIILFGVSTKLALTYENKVRPEYRLPNNIKPKNYTVNIITYLEEGKFKFFGNVTIKVLVGATTDSITLHAKNMNITDSEVTVNEIVTTEISKTTQLKITNFSIIEENDFIVIKLDKNLVPGKYYIIQLPFDAELTEDFAGYYRSSYIDKLSNKTRWLSLTQFQAVDARRAFPCFDEPAMKARFTINMGHKSNLKSVSNMPLVSITPMDDKEGWVWSRFEESVPMSTYLVAFMVSEFEYTDVIETNNKVRFGAWVRKDALHQVKFASMAAPKFLEFYEEYFNVKYPLPKQDLAAVPDLSDEAMENWGLITFKEMALLYDTRSSSAQNKYDIAVVLAHELAHQWFGNLVTMRWWTDLWLNEGFATFVASLGVHKVFPEWNSMDESIVNEILDVFSLDSLKSSHPVSVEVGNPDEIEEIFDSISYNKGSCLLRMMSNFMGEEVFKTGITDYLNAHEFSNAETDNLWESLTKAGHEAGTLKKELTVKEIMDSWTLQTGYPLITVTRDYEKGTAKIDQSRYFAVKSDTDAEENETSCWWVPISYTIQKENNFRTKLPKSWISCNTSVELSNVGNKDEWLILNIQISGLYRVQYDEHNWKILINTLNSKGFKNIGTLNRVQLLADSLDLAWSGNLDYNTTFNLVNYLKLESEYLPWCTGLAGLERIYKLLKRTASNGEFKNYMRNMISSIYPRFSKFDKTPKSYEEIKFKTMIIGWACEIELGDCMEQSLELFKMWKNEKDPDTNNPIPADVRFMVYCYGVKYGSEKEWNFLLQRYKNSNVASEKHQILRGLTCSRVVWILNKLLEMSIDKTSLIRRQDSAFVFIMVVENEVGYFVAKDFFYRNVKRIYKYLGSKSTELDEYISNLASEMIRKDELNELKWNLKLNNKIFDYSSMSSNKTIELTLINIRWYTDCHSTVLKVVSQFKM